METALSLGTYSIGLSIRSLADSDGQNLRSVQIRQPAVQRTAAKGCASAVKELEVGGEEP